MSILSVYPTSKLTGVALLDKPVDGGVVLVKGILLRPRGHRATAEQRILAMRNDLEFFIANYAPRFVVISVPPDAAAPSQKILAQASSDMVKSAKLSMGEFGSHKAVDRVVTVNESEWRKWYTSGEFVMTSQKRADRMAAVLPDYRKVHDADRDRGRQLANAIALGLGVPILSHSDTATEIEARNAG